MTSDCSGNVDESSESTTSEKLLSEIAETNRTLEDIERKKQEKKEQEELQAQASQTVRNLFYREEVKRVKEKIALGQESLELLSKLKEDPVFLEAFHLCMELNNQHNSARNKDRITIYERNLTNAVEANPENSWLVGYRKVLDTFRLDLSLNLIFRQYVPVAHMAEAMLEVAHPYEGEREITEEVSFANLNYETVKGFWEALRSDSVKQKLADSLKIYRSIAVEHND